MTRLVGLVISIFDRRTCGAREEWRKYIKRIHGVSMSTCEMERGKKYGFWGTVSTVTRVGR